MSIFNTILKILIGFILCLVIIVFAIGWFINYLVSDDDDDTNTDEEDSSSSSHTLKESFQGSQNKFVCMYAYYEKNDEYKENLKYFLKYAITSKVDYYIIVNGKCTVEIPKNENIQVLYRENRGFDFGAWEYCINNYIIPSKISYEYFIFLNSSVRGPMPSSLAGDAWLYKFLELFQNNNVKLAGTTINILMNSWPDYPLPFSPPFTHVQSMFFILNAEGFQYLVDQGFFADEETLNNTTDMKYIVSKKEITMSQLILKNNWNINAMLPNYRDKDYRYIKENFNPSSENPCRTGDDPDKKNYFGRDIYPEEVIFFKTNLSNI